MRASYCGDVVRMFARGQPIDNLGPDGAAPVGPVSRIGLTRLAGHQQHQPRTHMFCLRQSVQQPRMRLVEGAAMQVESKIRRHLPPCQLAVPACVEAMRADRARMRRWRLRRHRAGGCSGLWRRSSSSHCPVRQSRRPERRAAKRRHRARHPRPQFRFLGRKAARGPAHRNITGQRAAAASPLATATGLCRARSSRLRSNVPPRLPPRRCRSGLRP